MKLLFIIGPIVVAFGVIAFLFLRRSGRVGGIRSVAIFRASHLSLTEARVRAIVGRALGDTPEIDFLPMPEREDGAQLFAFVREGLAFGVISVPKPYVNPAAHEEIRATLSDPLAVRGMTEHRAWVSVDHMRGVAELAEINSVIGRVIAELLDDEAMLLYDVKHGKFATIDEMTRDMLRGPVPMIVFGADGTDVSISVDDEAMEAAKRKAQERWSEFLIAWHNRQPEEMFSVKGPFHDGARTEHMWVTVEEADEGGVRGKIGNKPTVVRNIAENDPASVAIADVEDWMIFEPSGKMRGGFSMGTMLARKMG